MGESTLIQPKNYEKYKKYPLVSDFKGVINDSLYKEYKNYRAIEVLEGPLEMYTNLPYRMLHYLHENKEKNVPRVELIKKATGAGYELDHIYKTIKEFLPKQPNIGIWWDNKEKKEYYRWYDMTENEYKAKERDIEWFNAL